MMTDTASTTILFMHLHRTGGTTFLKLTDAIYDTECTYTIKGKRFREAIEEFKQLPETQRKRYQLIKGHMFFGLHKFCPRDSLYITMLRHPYERAISQYHWHLRPECLYPIPAEMTLIEFLESGRFISSDNGMTRFIAGKDRDSVEYGNCSQKMVELAKKNVQNHFLTIGLTECFDESLVLFTRLLGWEKQPFYKKKHVHKQKPKYTVSDQEQEVLTRYNTYDLELYDYAKKIFEAQICEQGASFENEVSRFKRLNAERGKNEDQGYLYGWHGRFTSLKNTIFRRDREGGKSLL